MTAEKILVVGACGQIGTELTLALRALHGPANVLAADIRSETGVLKGSGPFLQLDIMDKKTLQVQVKRHQVTQIYLLSAVLSATGEQYPHKAWQLNMQSLLNTLEVAREEKLNKIFWPSSIAVFGPGVPKYNCPQQAVLEPTTVYGISKQAGEQWCNYYHRRYGVDVRSLRYPGLISYMSPPGGGTTDYAVEIFHEAVKHNRYTCFLEPETVLPMMYMPDALRATLELMEAPAEKLTIRSAYNIEGMSFSPRQVAAEIRKLLPGLQVNYEPDHRQDIAASWPCSISDSKAQADWGWHAEYNLSTMTTHLLEHLALKKTVAV
jgi:nucleoside-diphosphate-sugar epimerase